MLENESLLIRQAQAGNTDAFGILYDHYLAPIYRFVFLKISDKSETEDLVHEIFLSAWKNICNFSPQGFPFSSWLYQIARNKVIDHYRTKKTHLTLETLAEEKFKTTDAIAHQIDTDTELREIKNAMQQLNEDQQNILLLRFVEDLSYQEIAALLNKNEGAIRLIQHRALRNLKKILKTNDHTA